MEPASSPSRNDPGLPNFDRLFKRVKGDDREPPREDFQPPKPEPSETRRAVRRFSANRVGLLLIVVWATTLGLGVVIRVIIATMR